MVVIFIGSSSRADVQEPEATTGILAPVIRVVLEQAAESSSPEVWPDVTHFTEFAILAVLAYWAMRTIPGLSSWSLRAAVFAFTILYAISDEVHQAFVPDRMSSVEDVLLDAVGGAVGLGIAEAVSWVLRFVVRRRERGVAGVEDAAGVACPMMHRQDRENARDTR